MKNFAWLMAVLAALVLLAGIFGLAREARASAVPVDFESATAVVQSVDLPVLGLEGGGADLALTYTYDDASLMSEQTALTSSATPVIPLTNIATYIGGAIAVLAAILGITRGGVYFIRSSVVTFARGLFELTRRATTNAFHVMGAGRTTRTTIPVPTTQHRLQAVENSHAGHDADRKGMRRWLQRTIPSHAGRVPRLA